MKELSLEEISLLEEMKSNCLKKSQYIDDKAKDKFYMLCHLEDFSIAYYELLDVIKEVREYIEELAEDTEDYIGAIDRRRKVELLEILDKAGKENDIEFDVEFDVLKALNTDLDDDVVMG